MDQFQHSHNIHHAAGTRGWTAGTGRDLAGAARAAQRHSRVVRFLRVAVPAGSIIALAILSGLINSVPRAKLRTWSSTFVSGTKLIMAAPRIAGFTTAGRAYEATAESAAQDMTNLDVLELSGIRGKTELQDKSVINLAAASGIYDSKSEIIKLNQRVSVASSSGVELNLTEALVMVREGKIVSRRPVEVHHGNDTLNSNELEVINSGELIRFIGDVRVKLNPKDSDHDSPTKSPQRTQVASGVPQVFSRNPNEPVQIQSATLDVRSKEHIATFMGKVHLVQGDATLKCATLIISYQERADSGADQFGIAGQQQIRSVDARGGVTITQKEQTATGDSGTFDMKANKVLLTGNVALKQGQNVVRGDRLIADLSTGVSRIESNGHSNVQSEFVSNSQERKSRPDPEVNNTRQTPLSQPLKLH